MSNEICDCDILFSKFYPQNRRNTIEGSKNKLQPPLTLSMDQLHRKCNTFKKMFFSFNVLVIHCTCSCANGSLSKLHSNYDLALLHKSYKLPSIWAPTIDMRGVCLSCANCHQRVDGCSFTCLWLRVAHV